MSVLSKERLTEKTKDCFGYRLKDGPDAEVGFFKDYDAFYSHMMTVKALAEYEDLEEQSLLLRLPCPIGTKVYYIQQCLTPSCKECLGFTRVDNCYTQYKARIFEQEFDYRHLKAFGESVFLTQSEAEEKLRELEGM